MEAIAGPELDQRVVTEVLNTRSTDQPPPSFSRDERAAMELAVEVSRRTGWRFEVSCSGGLWSVTWIEDRRREAGDARRRKIGALVTATGPTRPLAICRALVKAARLPRWPLRRSRAHPAAGRPRAESLAS